MLMSLFWWSDALLLSLGHTLIFIICRLDRGRLILRLNVSKTRGTAMCKHRLDQLVMDITIAYSIDRLWKPVSATYRRKKITHPSEF